MRCGGWRLCGGIGLRSARRCALVILNHRGGVHRRRRRKRRRRQALVGHCADAGPMPVLQAAPVIAIAVLLVGAGRPGRRNEINKRPQVSAGNLHDVVGFLAQRPGDRPVSFGRDVHDDHSEPEILHLGNDLGEILFRADDDRITHRAVPGQRGEVAVHLGFHALAAAGTGPAEPQLDPGKVGQRVVLGTAPSLDRRLIPVAAQHRQAGTIPGQPGEQLDQARVIPGGGLTLTRSVDGHGAIGEHVARVHEKRATIHAIPPFPSTRDVTSASRVS